MCEDPHNLFFYANVCHVCKAFGKKCPLKRCGNCKMISYCGKEHQKQHWLQHKDLCRVLTEMTDETGSSSVFETNENASPEAWARMRTNLMLLARIKVNRPLLPYEEQMFKFPRACVVCHETKSRELKDCRNCPSASFCSTHEQSSKHAKQCASLKLCFDLDVAGTLFVRQVPRHVVPFHTETAYLPAAIKDFISLYVNENRSLPMTSECRVAYTSEFLTRPLTLLYAMQHLEYSPKSEMTIHVIGANMIEVDGLEVWEILLHWLPFLSVLTIVLIGPELNWGGVSPNVCDCCAVEDMRLHVEIRDMLYQDYAKSESFEKPDYIIGYNCGIHECEVLGSAEDTWSPLISILPERDCPFVLTSYTSDEACKEYERVRTILKDSVECVCREKNPFSSLRPHRDYETDEVYYQNQFISIYRKV